MIERAGRLAVRAVAVTVRARSLDVALEGGHHLPRRGPALVVSRHYHHLYDGAALITSIGRPVHLLVALDWTRTPHERRRMERLCAMAGWPVALRAENLGDDGVFRRNDRTAFARRALDDAANVLRAGHVLVVFPEGYPTIDPAGVRKSSDDAFLPFRPGFATIAARAERAGSGPVAIVPAGLAYRPAGERTHVTVRFGAAHSLGPARERARLIAGLERAVRELSAP